MKVKCKLCGKDFEADEICASIFLEEVVVECPNGCLLYTVRMADIEDIEVQTDKKDKD